MAVVKENIQIALAKEVTWGTAPARTVLMPITSFNGNREVAHIIENGVRGVAAKDFNAYRGGQSSKVSLEGWAFEQEIGYLLYAMMGAVNTTGTTDLTHAFSIAALPPSFTFEEDLAGVENRLYSGAYCEELSFKWATYDQPLTYSSSFRTKKDANGTTKTALTDLSLGVRDAPFLGRQASLTIGGTPNTKMIDGEISLKRTLTTVYTANNTDDVGQIVVGAIECTGRMTVDFSASTEVDLFRNGTIGTLKIEFTIGAKDKLTFDVNRCYYEGGEIDRGKEYITVALQFRGLYDATLAGPCKFTLLNGKTSY